MAGEGERGGGGREGERITRGDMVGETLQTETAEGEGGGEGGGEEPRTGRCDYDTLFISGRRFWNASRAQMVSHGKVGTAVH